MRKLFVLLCYSGALLFLVSACGNTDEDASDSTNTAVGLGQRFIEELYSVDNSSFDYNGMTAESLIHAQNEFSSYFTEKEFEELANKRFFLMPLEAASNQNNTISVQNIEFEKTGGDPEESNSLDFDHSFTLIFKDQEGNEQDKVKIEGQMTVIDTENGLKIDRYHDSEIPIEKLNH
ncbi:MULTISPECIES: hypothetical protein [Virgibacillus]|uniref:Uncharacterized protein n=2 Tax=Virgibacillus TaxID=84406 RepID=A0A024QF41_9BACI|nr:MULTISPECIES: hypothetical protein [Virgibacillus]EQB35297.1 hypothetical protein M948_19550 [Virgibacillus sp. CM-4]GGJ75957.1 hypothetical protein GCM10007111_41860 [Virgibacillus kapii]CDQ40561.1 hypothetical protein BN990_02886 [Virgibacillus massiliensis]